MVVSVVVGLRHTSISILSGCRFSRRSRKDNRQFRQQNQDIKSEKSPAFSNTQTSK
jgi:hypothetical protein